MGTALLIQFPDLRFERRLIPFISTVEEARKELQKSTCPLIDFFDPHMASVESILNAKGMRAAARLHGVGDIKRYNNRMAAVEHAVAPHSGRSAFARAPHQLPATVLHVHGGSGRSGVDPRRHALEQLAIQQPRCLTQLDEPEASDLVSFDLDPADVAGSQDSTIEEEGDHLGERAVPRPPIDPEQRTGLHVEPELFVDLASCSEAR